MAASAPVVEQHYLCIYPAYINSKKTLAEGRRIAKDKCVENPTVSEIKDVCVAAGLKTVVENKLYPREMFKGDVSVRGRVRVELKNKENELMTERFKDKLSLMLHLTEMIPKLKSRVQKSGGGEQVQQKKKKGQKKR